LPKTMILGIDIRSLAGGAYTGVGEYTRNLLKYMTPLDKGIQFKLFFNAQSYAPDIGFLDGRENIRAYFFRYPNKYFSATTRFFNTPKIDKMIGGCDVFFSPHFIAAPVSQSCKKVITFHDLSFERYPEFFDLQRKFWHFSNRPKRQALAADKIIAVSESTAYDLRDIYGADSHKIFVVYSGVDNSFSKEIAQDDLRRVKAKYNLPDNFVFSLSTIEPRKNVYGTIKAFELLKNYYKSEYTKVRRSSYFCIDAVSLVIAGKPGWLYRDVFNTIKKSKYRNDIRYIGFIDDADKPALYKLSSAFVYPSIYEGFGFPVLEAMAAGTPVITSACSSLPEVAEDAALLVDPFKISDIAWVMKEVLCSEKLASSLIKKGLLQAEKFSWQKCAEETLKVLLTSV